MINTIKKFIKKVTKPYTGVPAPKVLQDDPWFGPAFISDANKDYMEREYEAINDHYSLHDTKEPDNIHEVMYNIATKGGNTTTQLDPMPEFGGGSENFQSGPGGWMSGTGIGQFS